MMDQDGESDWLELSATSLLVYSFLRSCSKRAFDPELDALGKQLLAPKLQFLSEELDDGELETDGNRCGRLQIREPVANEEIFQSIGTQLAQLGDQLDAEIKPSLINHLVLQFAADNLSREEITRHLSQAVQILVKRMPSGIEKEKAMLVIAMVLARNVANTVPSLLHRVFSTTVNYINQNLQDYVNNLPRES
ncbi:BH3-interacting domain death agonist [Tiliqua scincoides]|uniref:BH3-interacting domain death agonist n=1 Tax=Tiliqua scincoides TaxID=71010 RepID=UPI00346208BA